MASHSSGDELTENCSIGSGPTPQRMTDLHSEFMAHLGGKNVPFTGEVPRQASTRDSMQPLAAACPERLEKCSALSAEMS